MNTPASIPYICLECKAPGIGSTEKRQFCNSICANKYKRKTLREGDPTGYIVCEFCKEEFPYWQAYDDTFYGGNHKQFCGYKCSNSFTRLQRVAANGDEPEEDIKDTEVKKKESVINRLRHCFRDGIRCKYYTKNWLDSYAGNCDCKRGYSPEEKKETEGSYDDMLGGVEYSIGNHYF